MGGLIDVRGVALSGGGRVTGSEKKGGRAGGLDRGPGPDRGPDRDRTVDRTVPGPFDASRCRLTI